MGMSTRVVAYISDKDPTYQKHASVLRACIDADIEELPKETALYFGSKHPEEYLLEEKLEIDMKVNEYSEDDSEIYEVLVEDIPQGTYKIKFSNNW